jgi:hypothetical protein
VEEASKFEGQVPLSSREIDTFKGCDSSHTKELNNMMTRFWLGHMSNSSKISWMS